MPHADNSSSRGPDDEQWMTGRGEEISQLHLSKTEEDWEKSIPLIKEAIGKAERWTALQRFRYDLYMQLVSAYRGLGRTSEADEMEAKAVSLILYMMDS